MRTQNDLAQMQALPLSLKVRMTKQRIRQWVDTFGTDGVYIAFSGGKDSTVLLHLVREEYPDIPAVFVNTGLEYPEIVKFVKTFENVEIIRPQMNFKKVIEKYGYPFISKEVSGKIHELHHAKNTDSGYYQKLLARFEGEYVCKTNGKKSMFNLGKWKFLLDAPFPISARCCNVMKKNPSHDYAHKTGRKPITAQMADESLLRRTQWLLNGCNGFNLRIPTSNPMAFWTENDVLRYIKENNVEIVSVYGDIVPNEEVNNLPEGQLCFLSDEHILTGKTGELLETPCKYKTTGCYRTGCMFCGYGAHLEKAGQGRFERMKKTHPKLYEWIMKPKEEGGLDYKNVIDWINEHGNLNIRY